MDLASNSENGIGLSQDELVSRIEGLLDSGRDNVETPATAEAQDAENEVDETSLPLETTDETSDEQSVEDSDEEVEGEAGEADETDEPKSALNDDAEIDLNGQKLTLKELKQGYERHADYTRKTQKLAEVEKQVAGQVDQIREGTIQYFQNLEREIATLLPQEPDWAQLSQDDPAEYIAQQEKWKAIHARIQHVRQERAVLEQQQAQRAEAEHKAALADGQKRLAEMHPELAKAETGKAQALGKYLVDLGIPAEAISRETNPILFSIAYKAMLFEELQKQKAQARKVVEQKPLIATPGSSAPRGGSDRTAIDRKMGNLKRTGSLEDAAAVLMHRLK